MHPYDGNAVLEINPTLVFPILEMLLGGPGKGASKLSREVTEIEQSILDGLYRIILNDLRSAWQQVCALDFKIEAFETEPQLLQILAPNEAVVAISMEIRIGESCGMMNLGIPSIVIKMLRQKFDQQWSVRRTQATEEHNVRVLQLIKPSEVMTEARLRGPRLSVEDLMQIEPGNVLTFDYPLDKPLDFLINGRLKFQGQVVGAGRKRAFHIEQEFRPAE
jgi:flagellar motor switch protein FliM